MQKSVCDAADPGKTALRARGRPREFDRDAALSQAMRLFWSKGYEATSMSDLTSAMGIGSTSLYAAFGSKEALYVDALEHYQHTYWHLVWGRFDVATTAREAIEVFLLDSAAALTGSVVDIPRGCMVTLSAVGSEGYAELGKMVRSARAVTVERLAERVRSAVVAGELPESIDVQALARFVQTVQYGMSVLARDGVSRAELEAVAAVAMLGWDAKVADATADQGKA